MVSYVDFLGKENVFWLVTVLSKSKLCKVLSRNLDHEKAGLVRKPLRKRFNFRIRLECIGEISMFRIVTLLLILGFAEQGLVIYFEKRK